MEAAPAASSKPIKTEDAITLENMFDDLEEEKGEQEVKDEEGKGVVELKKPGNWDSDVANGIFPLYLHDAR